MFSLHPSLHSSFCVAALSGDSNETPRGTTAPQRFANKDASSILIKPALSCKNAAIWSGHVYGLSWRTAPMPGCCDRFVRASLIRSSSFPLLSPTTKCLAAISECLRLLKVLSERARVITPTVASVREACPPQSARRHQAFCSFQLSDLCAVPPVSLVFSMCCIVLLTSSLLLKACVRVCASLADLTARANRITPLRGLTLRPNLICSTLPCSRASRRRSHAGRRVERAEWERAGLNVSPPGARRHR